MATIQITKLRIFYPSIFRTEAVSWAQSNRTAPSLPNSAQTIVGALADQSVDVWSDTVGNWRSYSYTTVRSDNVVAATTALRAMFTNNQSMGGRAALDAILNAMPDPPDVIE